MAKIRHSLKSKVIAEHGFRWTKKCNDEFQNIIKELKSSKFLGHPDFSESAEKFVLSVDSCSKGIGAILSQFQKVMDPKTNKISEKEVIIAFGSQSLTSSVGSHSSFALELSGIVTSVNHFKFFLSGASYPFLIRTDNREVRWLMTTTNPNLPDKIFRWQQFLSDYNFKVEYVSCTS